MEYIPIQLELKPELPNIVGNKDYTDFKNLLERIDELLINSDIEELAFQSLINSKKKEIGCDSNEAFLFTQKVRIKKMAIKALRCNIARHLTQESFRCFAAHLADSALLQRFCGLATVEKIRIPGKSCLENYSKLFDESSIRGWIMGLLNQSNREKRSDYQALDLENPVDFSEVYFDSTCLKANIHFPVDWILLKDGIITLMKAVTLIRSEGLKNRMNDPTKFIRAINRLSIEMTHCRRIKDSKKMRKKILRKMKTLCKIITNHALLHQDLLEQHWNKTKYSEKQADQIIRRIKRVLEQLPEAIKQAHERMIGERQVASKDKILSLYESDIHVIIRGKAGAEVEFGNTLLIAEQQDGLILDWKLIKEISSGDPLLMRESLGRMERDLNGFQPNFAVGDRGFWSKETETFLEDKNIKSAICPKNVVKLTEKLKDKEFARLQARRGQTEGRIGIIKNKFLGNPMKSKGFNHQEINVAWAIFTHNFWVLARLPKAKETPLLLAA